MTKDYTAQELTALLAEKYGDEAAPEVAVQLNTWLARGDGVAVYENNDLSHYDMGHVKITSFGGRDAQLKDTHHDPNPPERLPDGLPKGHINWRYTLVGTYRGAALPLVVTA
jgi:hypothetical protein